MMTESETPWRLFGILLRLRYRLLWAQARSRTGKAMLFFALYVFGMLAVLFFALGGFSAAFAAVRLGREIQIARGILAGIMVAGLAGGLFFGAGPRNSFSDVVLRRYPLTSKQQLAVRHLIGLLDPIWPLLLALVAGLTAGFALAHPWRLLIGLPAAVLYVSLVYLITVTILSAADRLLQYRAGPTILGFALVILINLAVFAPRLLIPTQNRGWTEGIDQVLRYLPPGAAAPLIAGAGNAEMFVAVWILAMWFLIPASVLYFVENLGPVAVSRKEVSIAWDSPFDRVACWIGPVLGPLVAKWLRSYLRSQQGRFGLAAAIPFVVGLPWLFRHGGGQEKICLTTLAFMFWLGALTVGAASSNMFGIDGKGIRRYLILPVSLDRVLAAGSIAAMILGAAMILPTLIAALAVTNIPFDVELILLSISNAIAGIFYFNAADVWTSVLSPFPVDPRNMLGNRAPVGVTLIRVLLLQPAVVLMLRLGNHGTLEMMRKHLWLWFAAVPVCGVMFAISLFFTGRILLARRERLFGRIAAK